MSYILDALKRADSERERGIVPGLHAQPVPPRATVSPISRDLKLVTVLVIGVGLIVVGGFLWRWLGSQSPTPVVVQAAPAVLLAPAAGVAAVSPPTAPIAPLASTPGSTSAPAIRVAPAPTRAPVMVSPQPAPAPIPELAELPADTRLALPKLVISGSTYSDNPAYRMLVINGQVFREGEKVATDLLLERIRPKSAVLNYKGQRYAVGYQ